MGNNDALGDIVKIQFVEFLQTFRTSPDPADKPHYEQKVLQMRQQDRRTLYVKHAHIFFTPTSSERDYSPAMSFERAKLSQVIAEHYHRLVSVLREAVDMYIR